MKAFRFRPARVLDWREVERARAASRWQAAQAALARFRLELSSIDEALARGADGGITGAALANWAAWQVTLRRHRLAAVQRVATAEAALRLEQGVLLEASRRVKLLEQLRETAWGRWQRDLEHETSAIAAELHLSRYNRIAGARSSSG